MSGEPPVTPLAYQRRQAAAALGIGVDTFDRHVRPRVRVVYVGGARLYPVADLQRWLAETASSPVVSPDTTKRPRAAGTAGGMAQGEATP